MIPVKLLWTPHPHRGGFAIVDHTDGASLEGVRIVYDFLDSLGLRATKTVWAFEPEGPSGIPPLPASVLRGVTLETRAYREYCAELVRRGFEIALHGASAGNNRRDRTLAAFERLERELKTGARTYVCHAKNAENPYWQARAVDRSPLRWVMKLVASRHRCSGEIPTSPYFWGDVCRERVRYVRLFRTAQLNTLAANPSMPYFEREKPYVRGWFTMTDRSLGDATRPEALAMLSHENGLCILRQHLARHADPESWSVRPGFEAAMRRLRGAPDLWVDTAGAMLDRLKLIEGVVLAYRDSNLWVVNLNAEPVERFQLEMGERPRPQGRNIGIEYHDGVAVIERLPPASVTYLDCSAPLFIADRNAVELDGELHGRWDFGHGACWLNFGPSSWLAAGRTLAPATFAVAHEPGCAEVQAMSQAPAAEITRLCLGHARLLVPRRRDDRRDDRTSRGPRLAERSQPGQPETKRWRTGAR